jgi:hypothetical protein
MVEALRELNFNKPGKKRNESGMKRKTRGKRKKGRSGSLGIGKSCW